MFLFLPKFLILKFKIKFFLCYEYLFLILYFPRIKVNTSFLSHYLMHAKNLIYVQIVIEVLPHLLIFPKFCEVLQRLLNDQLLFSIFLHEFIPTQLFNSLVKHLMLLFNAKLLQFLF